MAQAMTRKRAVQERVATLRRTVIMRPDDGGSTSNSTPVLWRGRIVSAREYRVGAEHDRVSDAGAGL
jgi:hypothetical protein